jgi:hypothetical protein
MFPSSDAVGLLTTAEHQEQMVRKRTSVDKGTREGDVQNFLKYGFVMSPDMTPLGATTLFSPAYS